jgi:hypothetical protein
MLTPDALMRFFLSSFLLVVNITSPQADISHGFRTFSASNKALFAPICHCCAQVPGCGVIMHLSCAGMPVESEVYFCPDHLMVLQVITRTKPHNQFKVVLSSTIPVTVHVNASYYVFIKISVSHCRCWPKMAVVLHCHCRVLTLWPGRLPGCMLTAGTASVLHIGFCLSFFTLL